MSLQGDIQPGIFGETLLVRGTQHCQNHIPTSCDRDNSKLIQGCKSAASHKKPERLGKDEKGPASGEPMAQTTRFPHTKSISDLHASSGMFVATGKRRGQEKQHMVIYLPVKCCKRHGIQHRFHRSESL
eukprot:TRINITY_DN21476_c0_g1_i1.p2 TRINITY_DN21476_c0_g1~~TRINITY_DN21476_c0_g1_i1.p2  ORF type:complete len:129 (+),score=0.62 TRINITY_DN21476_c0_g1_i1:283-669(+)